MPRGLASTFSLVARDPATSELGVAVQSRFFAVGAAVPWLRAEVGAIATQSWINVAYGPDGLGMLADGASAQEVVQRLTRGDPGRDLRQVGVVDARGGSAAHTGRRCIDWAGEITGENFACQGNTLAGERVVRAMVEAFLGSMDRLPERLVAALRAGQAEGGDWRGMQSAALVVVRAGGGFGGRNDRYLDLRVDDHVEPIEELARLLRLFRASPYDPDYPGPVALERDVVIQTQLAMKGQGLYDGPVDGRVTEALMCALREYHRRIEMPFDGRTLSKHAYRRLLEQLEAG